MNSLTRIPSWGNELPAQSGPTFAIMPASPEASICSKAGPEQVLPALKQLAKIRQTTEQLQTVRSVASDMSSCAIAWLNNRGPGEKNIDIGVSLDSGERGLLFRGRRQGIHGGFSVRIS